MDQTKIVETLKLARSTIPLGLQEQILCARDEKFLVSVLAPRDAELSHVLLGGCIPAFYADEAVYVVDSQFRPEGADRSIPIDQDPTAVPALLVVFSDRSGLRTWQLCPYGISDEGAVAWLENDLVPDVEECLELFNEVYALGDCRDESVSHLHRMQTNGYNVVASRSVLEGT